LAAPGAMQEGAEQGARLCAYLEKHRLVAVKITRVCGQALRERVELRAGALELRRAGFARPCRVQQGAVYESDAAQAERAQLFDERMRCEVRVIDHADSLARRRRLPNVHPRRSRAQAKRPAFQPRPPS